MMSRTMSTPRPPLQAITWGRKSPLRWSMLSSAPKRCAHSPLSGPPSVEMAFKPNSRASMSAVEPMPLVPPCTSRVSPARARPVWKRLAQTVKKVSGRAAACAALRPAGWGSNWVTGTTQYSA